MSSPPPVPLGMTQGEFGQRLWGSGPSDAERRLLILTRDELDEIGLTHYLARQWRDFYRQAVQRERGRPTSEIRSSTSHVGMTE